MDPKTSDKQRADGRSASSRFMRRNPIAAAAMVIWLCAGALPALGQDATVDPSRSPAMMEQPADDGARIVRVETLSPRARDLTIESPAVGTAQVRLLLPAAYEERPSATFPVLYLLHGGGGEYADWTEETEVEAVTAPTSVIVAMPAAASSSLDTWMEDGGPDGQAAPPDWEAFHLFELQQLLERNWRAAPDRAIGGLSLGGYGAVMYAAQHPDLFDAVASFSGALDLTVARSESDEVQAFIDEARRIAEAAGWDEENPVNLVDSLVGTTLYISYGNGEPGPLDPAGTESDDLEAWIGRGDDNYVAALEDAGVPATVNAYGPGTHSWPYWERELRASLPTLLAALGDTTEDATAATAP